MVLKEIFNAKLHTLYAHIRVLIVKFISTKDLSNDIRLISKILDNISIFHVENFSMHNF